MDAKMLRIEMRKNHVTQKELAEKCGISTTTFSKKMNDLGLFTCREAVIISTTLHLSPMDRAVIFLL